MLLRSAETTPTRQAAADRRQSVLRVHGNVLPSICILITVSAYSCIKTRTVRLSTAAFFQQIKPNQNEAQHISLAAVRI